MYCGGVQNDQAGEERAASAAITLAVKAAAVAATDKRARTAIASVVVAMFLSFILMTFMILCALDGTSTHNFSAVDLSFHGGALPAKVPEEYWEYIEDIRKSFQDLDGLIAGVENLEDGQIDAIRVKSYFYALHFGEEQPSRCARKAFVECFLRYEERTREVEEEDGSITEETYTAAVFLTDQEEICSNLESLLGRTLTMEERANAQRIYTTAVYGRVGPGSFEAGEAMGDSGRCSRKPRSISATPMCGAAPPLPLPLIAAGISAGSTHSPVSTTCPGQRRKGFITSAPSYPVRRAW